MCTLPLNIWFYHGLRYYILSIFNCMNKSFLLLDFKILRFNGFDIASLEEIKFTVWERNISKNIFAVEALKIFLP